MKTEAVLHSKRLFEWLKTFKNSKITRKWPYWLFTALLPNPVRFITGGDAEEGVSPGERGRYVTHSTHSANKQVVTLMRETVAKCFWHNGWQQWIVIPWLEQQGSEGELALMAWTFLSCIINIKQSKQHAQHQPCMTTMIYLKWHFNINSHQAQRTHMTSMRGAALRKFRVIVAWWSWTL